MGERKKVFNNIFKNKHAEGKTYFGSKPLLFRRQMREIILFKDGQVSMLYKDDCRCHPLKKKRNFLKWLGDIFAEVLKGLARHPEVFL